MRYYYLEDGQLKESRRKLIIAFKGRLRATGSRYMRCDQLAGFVQRHHADRYDVSVEVLPNPQRKPSQWKKFLKKAQGAVVITLKGSLDVLKPEELDALRTAVVALGIDHVDSFAGGEVFRTADLHIAASQASQIFMTKKCERISRRDGFEMPRIELVDHHADERVVPAPQPSGDQLKMAYIGDPRNTFIPDEIRPYMLEFSAQAQSDFEQVLNEIGQAHLHYCVRANTKLRQPKPFTKGFTAALADRNLLCTPAVPDAVRFLGEDYPFMARGEDARHIVEAVENARDALGSTQWNEGLSRIRAMREQVRPERVAQQLIAVVDSFY